jgi:AraC family transcriptional regulator
MKYEDRIQHSVDFIDRHLMDEISLEEIAGESGYSLSHFYKVFPAITGFSIKEFVRNKRLAYAARELVGGDRRILDIALDSGFKSQEVFTRAFAALYGDTPGTYRQTRQASLDSFDSADAFAREMEKRGQRQPLEIPVRTEVIQRGWMHLVGMEMETSVAENIDNNVIPAFWQEIFVPRYDEIEGKTTPNTAIAYEVHDPETEVLLHMACFEVSDPSSPPPGMAARSLAPGHYAVFTPQRHLDPYEYTALVRYAYGEWFPMSGCEIRADYSLDLYIQLHSRDGKEADQQLSLMVPIFPPPRRAEVSGEPSPYTA